MDWPKDRFNPLQFALLILTLNIVLGWLHELFHCATAQLFGGQAHVVNMWMVFATDITVWPTSEIQKALIVYAGGLGTAAVCAWLWLLIDDPEFDVAIHAIAWSQFFYGFTEGTLYMINQFNKLPKWGFIAMLMGTLYAIARSKKLWTGET